MFLSTPVKIFHLIWIFPLIFTGCGGGRGNENSSMQFATPPKNESPFADHEPEVFQTDVIITSGDFVRRISIARDGNKRRTDFDVGTDVHRAIIITDKQYILDFKRSAYTERAIDTSLGDLYEPTTAQLLNLRDYADFNEIDRDGSIVKYQSRLNDSAESEATIYYDESIGMPVKIQFYGMKGDERTLHYAVELRNFKTSVEEGTFQLPKGLRRNATEK